MTNDDMTLAQLHANRETLRAAWMTRVEDAKRFGRTHLNFHATGPILRPDNSLWYFVYIDGARAYDLVCDASGSVTEVHA